MSCGRHRRRPKIFSRFNSRLSSQNESSIATKPLGIKSHQLAENEKANGTRNSSEPILDEKTLNADRFRIFDDDGNDVTPRLITDYVHINIKHLREDLKLVTENTNKRETENRESLISEKSIIGTINATNSTSQIAHIATLVSTGEKTTLDIGTRIILESEKLLSQTHHNQISCNDNVNEKYQAMFLAGVGIKSTDDLSTDYIVLNETETIFILDLSSYIVGYEDNSELDKINEKNKIYTNLCKSRQDNDLYLERSMNTFNDFRKHKQIITDPVLIRSQESWCSTWDLYDSDIEANQHEGKIYRQYALRKNQDIYDNHIMHNRYRNENVEEKILSAESSKTYSSHNSPRFFSRNSLVESTFSKNNCFQRNDNNTDQLPEIDVDALIMERILNLSTHYTKQLVYRNINKNLYIKQESTDTSVLKDNISDTFNKEDQALIKSPSLNLERLWHYNCYLTQNRNVSCLCWNKQNHDLLAAGYGQFQYNDDREGLVCCWSTKNLEFPERYFHTNAGVTSLSFSFNHSNLLAVGLFNGNICVFDLNQNNSFPIFHTNKYDKKHTSPIWQIVWNEQDHASELNNVETLVSISSDGRITQWILRKEFEATDFARLKPYVTTQMASQELSKNDEINITHYFSKFVGGLCLDFRSNDQTIYLCGTEEGIIHRCSTIYNEKYLESYIGHTAPVYKVHWSPFAENIFLSASADWTVRLWMVGHNRPCMIFPSSNSKVFFDAIWSPKSSTMFCCVSESTIEIWDLSKSTLDPICVASSADQRTLTAIDYTPDADCVLVGTSDGAVWVYHLTNLSSSANANDLITIVEQSLLSQIDSFEKH